MERPRRLCRRGVILPPEDSDESLADDTDEDPDFDPRQRPRRGFNLPASRFQDDDTDSEVSSEEDPDEPGPSARKKKKDDQSDPPPVWYDVSKNCSETTIPVYECRKEYRTLNCPIDYFKYFFDDELITEIIEQSNLFSVQKNITKPLNTFGHEIEQFIGICAYMSIYGLPRSRMYWGSKTRIEKVADVMPRNRWEDIKANLHFNDNSLMPSLNDPKRDRLYKVRPLVDSLQQKFKAIPVENQMLCVDEQVIPFKGKSYLKQYNPKKPHKWGYKLFVLCDSTGLVHNFDVYTGCIEPVEDLPDIGKSSNVVLRLLQHVPWGKNNLVYFDNWYSSPKLFVTLANMGFPALGTIRLNRFSGLQFTSDKEMKEKGRGSSEEKEAEIDGVAVRAIKWYDNKGVTLATTFESKEPLQTVQRFDKKSTTLVDVKCPRAITTYNKFMGGVDLIDGLISYYRIPIRSKKYYHRFFFHFIDMAVVTSWLMYKRDYLGEGYAQKGLLDLLEFKTEIAESLCKKDKDLTRRGRPVNQNSSIDRAQEDKSHRGPAKGIPIPVVRRDGVGHWPVFEDVRQRCRHPLCKDKSFIKCEKCATYLCLKKNKNCFVDFHKYN